MTVLLPPVCALPCDNLPRDDLPRDDLPGPDRDGPAPGGVLDGGPAACYGVDTRIEPGQPPALVLTGEIDLAATPAIAAAVGRLMRAARTATRPPGALSRPGTYAVTVQLGQVTFFDCAALGALIALQIQLASLGVALTITDPSPPVRSLLALTSGTHHLLEPVRAA